MGMYTELNMAVNLKDDTPEQVLDVLRYFSGELEEMPPAPRHEFFKLDRHKWFGKMGSYYFDWQPHTKLAMDDIGGAYFETVFNMKNYESEVQQFLGWLLPYVDAFPGDFLGYYRYEEFSEPTLILYPHKSNGTERPCPVHQWEVS